MNTGPLPHDAALRELGAWFGAHALQSAGRLLRKPLFEPDDANAILADLRTVGASEFDEALADKMLTLWLAGDYPVVRELAGASRGHFARLPLRSPVQLPDVPDGTVEIATDGQGALAQVYVRGDARGREDAVQIALARHFGIWAFVGVTGPHTLRASASWVEPPPRSSFGALPLPSSHTTEAPTGTWTELKSTLHEFRFGSVRVRVTRSTFGPNRTAKFHLLLSPSSDRDFAGLHGLSLRARNDPDDVRRGLLQAAAKEFTTLREARKAAETLARGWVNAAAGPYRDAFSPRAPTPW